MRKIKDSATGHPRENRKPVNLGMSLSSAVDGFLFVLKTERNMRIHFLLGVVVLIAGIYLNLPKVEIITLCITVTLVLLAEMVNTAIEHSVDMFRGRMYVKIRVIKDIAAGSVLLASLNAVVVGYMIFLKPLVIPVGEAMSVIRQSPWHLTFIALITVLAVVIYSKIRLHRGRPLRGGMPSGHAALAFAIWTAILFLHIAGPVVILAFILALVIAQSRVRAHIHTLWEVLAGTLLGILVTTLIFQLLK